MKNAPDPIKVAALAEGFKALSSPARVAIVMGLMEREMNAGEIVEMLESLECPCSVERTNVSKHLAVLREAGIVDYEEDGQRRVYRLALPCLKQSLSCMAARKSGQDRRSCCP
jgi:DNA-binding transcriptional ArsR family regulator